MRVTSSSCSSSRTTGQLTITVSTTVLTVTPRSPTRPSLRTPTQMNITQMERAMARPITTSTPTTRTPMTWGRSLPPPTSLWKLQEKPRRFPRSRACPPRQPLQCPIQCLRPASGLVGRRTPALGTTSTCPSMTTTRPLRTRTSTMARGWRTPSSPLTPTRGLKSPPVPRLPPVPPISPIRLRPQGKGTRKASSQKKPSKTSMRTTMTLTSTPTPTRTAPPRRLGRACRPTRTPSTKGSEDPGARKARKESRPSSSRACSSRGRPAQKDPQVFQDLQELQVPLAKWATLERGVPLGALAFLGPTACPAPREPCSCCRSALEVVEMRDPKAPWSPRRSPRPRPSSSRPGWH